MAAAKSRIKELPPSDSQSKLTNQPSIVLLDVREDNEWANGHAKGAVHMGRGVIDLQIEERYPDKENTEFMVYCQSGGRAAMVCDLMQELGYKKVTSVQGGYKAILGAGWEITK
ncbi:hypothetical protein FGO68_gene11292 [Halteria grandinella]|uniref:Rhodanese domain-containing protein n=1 Tax=Halteria grandinella TaxID=5974 RepID=A0A8J8NHK1_HALGN|nr:hypothetical protein FGO68_gene11292 [Halteria grandinella]